MGYKLTGLDLEVVAGPNTKQLWIYDNTNNVYIDPPEEVLEKIDEKYDYDWTSDEAQDDLLEQANKLPKWLFETDYWYDGDTEI